MSEIKMLVDDGYFAVDHFLPPLANLNNKDQLPFCLTPECDCIAYKAKYIIAPFTDEQVEALTVWQNADTVHPFTCGNRDGHPLDPEGDYGVLVATNDGWICRHCKYKQEWAWYFMVEEPPSSIFPFPKKKFNGT